MLAWQPDDDLPRQAFVVTLELGTGVAFEGVVDLSSRQIIRWQERPGIQPTEIWIVGHALPGERTVQRRRLSPPQRQRQQSGAVEAGQSRY